MNAMRKSTLEQKLTNADKTTKNNYIKAEEMCRKEFQKAFNFNLNLPLGHPKNLIQFSSEHEKKEQRKNIIKFWQTLKDRHIHNIFKKKYLHFEIIVWCDMQIAGMTKLLDN